MLAKLSHFKSFTPFCKFFAKFKTFVGIGFEERHIIVITLF